ncbi:beta-lactamase family protein [Allokutzneria sp. A3M-2-11 16]|uniref:serine hydrolase domain-containing protein n=1 Tax=Allokutzneria sp. A3M-2-11 16 TaxID=2962043 RepID=UPI0020B6D9B5|nr:serine hydrolase domain-containing protein [Allokutzneria sp. A3M-2-11 16]MCP3802390.1 beta-lactamase family protein [Allokutzneria sp. A3M-2-11 16]
MRELLAKNVESGAFPGIVALVDHAGETRVEVAGTLHVNSTEPMRRDTMFRMASATKLVTAAAVMALVEECRLRLHDPVDELLPELANRRVLTSISADLDDTVPAHRPITVWDLLTFTWGFGAVLAPHGSHPIQAAMTELGIGSDGTTPSAMQPDEWMRRLGTLPLMRQPGEKWLYNTGSDVLGVLIARASGKSFGEYLRERLLEPLGMCDTGFFVPEDKIHRLPTSYAHDPETGGLVVWDEAKGGKYSSPPPFEVGGDGLVSTADDYLAFYRMLLNKGTHNGERVLSRAGVELMTGNHLTAEQMDGNVFSDHGGFGLGMGVRTVRRGHASIGQFGWDGGLGTSTQADPERQLTGILLTQVAQDSQDTPRLIKDFWTTAYREID